jgi:acyl-coenzyme A synthetase/AMP-(fatty) acid ligase
VTTSRPSHTLAKAVQVAKETQVLLRSRVIVLGRPDRGIKQLFRLWRFGATLAGGYSTAAARAPRSVALIDENISRTFAEVDRRTQHLAGAFARLGIGPDTPLAILGRNSVPYVETLIAASRLGADVLLLSTFMSGTQLCNVIEREKAGAIVADPDLLPSLGQSPEDVPLVLTRMTPEAPDAAAGLPTIDDLLEKNTTDAPYTRVRGKLVVLTSGTTGVPKGAKRPAPTSLGPPASMLSRLRLQGEDTIHIAAPLFHTWGLGILQIAPSLAATVILRERPDPENVLRTIDEERCTALITVPVILERLMQLPEEVRNRYGTTSLRVVGTSGSALTPGVATGFQDMFGDILYNVYGATEISWATIATPEDLRAAAGTAGKPPLGTTLAILDEDDNPVLPGELGTVYVGNDLMFEGYTNGQDRPRFHGLMSTGDRGYQDADGRLMIVGRADDLIISGGENIYPLEVEATITDLPEVVEAAVVGRPDPELGQRLVAYVALADGASLTEEQIRDHVRGRLARFAVPKQVIFLDALPRNDTGKIVARMLPAPENVDRP